MKKALPVLTVVICCLALLVGCSNYDGFITNPGADTYGIVKWASVSLSTSSKNANEVANKITQQAQQHQASVASQEVLHDEDGIYYAYYSFNVSKENFDAFVDGLSTCAKVNAITVRQDNYSDQAQSIQNQITVLTNQKTQYQALYAQSTETADKMDLISRIADIDRQLLDLQTEVEELGAKDYYVVNVNLEVMDGSSVWGIIIGGVVFVAFWTGLIILIVKLSKKSPRKQKEV